MENSILNFAQQFGFRPEIKNEENFNKNIKEFVVGGMGGSHLAAGILNVYNSSLNIIIHKDYGLPELSQDLLKNKLFIASSYSGNTEETLDFLDEAYSRGFSVLAISKGGKLIDFAKKNKIPYILLPDQNIQPRVALGFTTIALSFVICKESLDELYQLENKIDSKSIKTEAEHLVPNFVNKIPIIYSDTKNQIISYIWKIKINETAKFPAFKNDFPELNHNEMQSYEFVKKYQNTSDLFHFIFIKDSDANSKISTRFEVLENLFEEYGLPVTSIYLEGQTKFEKIFNNLILSDWFSFLLAQKYNVEPEKVDFIEKFKNKIS
ncbi:MAG TPA: bifunctional phosphoglucose/phosphomannose isomerase [Candidatus Paceibacterota bacterium]|nr:bifunctional phosphoglucose/phosphomannose isomerase [Candidatus Paceibacterota bacterium]